MTHYPSLQPLRVPGGWNVSHNSWYKLDPDSESDHSFLTEDLLQLHHERCNLLVDVGWYGDWSNALTGEWPAGVFGAVVYRGDFHGILLADFRSQSQLEVVAVIEGWMLQPALFRDPEPSIEDDSDP
jgi:hypothetical protein